MRIVYGDFGGCMVELMMKQQLIERVNNKTAIVSVVGLGYVGVPLMLRYAEVGYKVIGIDIDQTKVDLLNKGNSYIEHISHEDIQTSIAQGVEVTSEFYRVTEADVLILCVPTPLNKYREPDLSHVIDTVDALIPYFREGQVLALESTTYPGTTEEELVPRVESTGLKLGEDVFLVYSPEREDPGNSNFSTSTIPKVVGGVTEACLDVGKAMYQSVIDRIIPVSSTKAAEMTKLLENIHRAVNIGLVNEMKIVADRMNIDIHEVINAAATKPFGFTPYYPGPGLGGHCIPVDPFYLTWKAREFDLHTRFIELAGEVNANMPRWVVGKVVDALNEDGKSLKGANILILGVAYKKDVDDIRESPALEIMKLLLEKGGNIEYTDPHIPVLLETCKYNFSLTSVDPIVENIKNYDLLLLVTNHTDFDYELFKNNAKLIVDTRGVYHGGQSNIVKA